MDNFNFLPLSREELHARGHWWYDILLVSGDAYVDHPSFGTALIGRLLESEGFRVAILAQPNVKSAEAFVAMGKPKLGVFISAGNLDSMVAHYTAAKKPRSEDFYSPGKKAGLRPDRASLVYTRLAREAFGDVPIVLGGLEASLRRFAHYDYWDDKVRQSALVDSGADLLVFGMGERASVEIAKRLKKKQKISEMHDIRGTAAIIEREEDCTLHHVSLPSFEQVRDSRRLYAEATKTEYDEHDHVRGRALLQAHGQRLLLVNPPAQPLARAELDKISELPYMRTYHPLYEALGGVAAIEEVRFSIIHNRGCFGGCNFCSLAFHQGRVVSSRSIESVVREATKLTKLPDFKGYINDVGGPTANFRQGSCKKQEKDGMCRDKSCLAPRPCSALRADHGEYLRLLRALRSIPGVKRVFVRSGIRYDFMLQDGSGEFFSELVSQHVSGQLKVAPEHCVDSVLDYMGKPRIGVYEKFLEKYKKLNERHNKAQFVVPYLMSSHPGSTLADAVALAEYLNARGRQPEQVQDFYPTPGTISTCMYHTEIDPRTMKPVYVAKSFEDKAMQRALLQWKMPDKRRLVIEALKKAGREDLIGFGGRCLVRPDRTKGEKTPPPPKATPEKPKKSSYKAGWARPKAKPGAKRGKGR